MALQAIKHGLPFPPWPTAPTGAPGSGSTYVIDAASEKAAAIYAATAAKAIRTIHVRTGTVTTGDTVDVRVETVDGAANGDPTGTLHTTNSNAALVIGSGDDNVWKSVALTADTAALSIGEVYAIVVVNGGGGGSMVIQNYVETVLGGFPYGDHFTAAWAKQNVLPLIVPQYSDGTFEPIFGYADSGGPINTNTFKSDDATNRRGNIFQLAFPARAKGAWAWVDGDATFTIKLYDSDGTTVLATTAASNAFQRQGTGAALHFHPFTSPANLSAATNYRLAVVPGTTSNIVTYDFDVPVAGMLDMFPGGQACHASVFTSSAWVQTTTRRAYMGVFLDAFDDAAAGAGANRALLPAGLSALG